VIKDLSEEEVLRILGESCILDLTKYEVGNTLWKEYMSHHIIEEDEFRELLALFQNIILRTKILTVEASNLSDVADVAAKEKITFYDASHIVIARHQDLTLVTEDEQLSKTSSKYTKTIPLN
jgi:predicted nucleic acid-binding protein